MFLPKRYYSLAQVSSSDSQSIALRKRNTGQVNVTGLLSSGNGEGRPKAFF